MDLLTDRTHRRQNSFTLSVFIICQLENWTDHMAHFTGVYQVLQYGKRLLERCHVVPFMQLIEIDIISFQPLQIGFAGVNQMMVR
ncbi:MAG: hypothetical protein GPOALKHO_000554 [Sodalis sp.]|nr:MAG: hypothetical protein GPOALKHO_000554 [Sodalis sp.]